MFVVATLVATLQPLREEMICPRCKTEYREGFYRCADCDIALVQESQISENSSEESGASELIRVYETTDSSLLSDVVLMIEDQDIPYLLQSGTAVDLDSQFQTGSLVWRGVLYAFENSLETIDSIIAKVKQDRKNQSTDIQEE
jgi:hypothetical protein